MEKEQLMAQIDMMRQHMVDRLTGHPLNNEYYYLKGMHDAFVDVLSFVFYDGRKVNQD